MWLIILALLGIACLAQSIRAVLIIIGGVLFFVVFSWQKSQSDKAERESLVGPDQIELVDVRYDHDKIKGRLRNNSPYEVRTVQLKLTMQDCTASGCETVDEATTFLLPFVPPGQARDFDDYATFYHLGTPHGTFKWSYAIVGMEAEPYVRGRGYEASWR